MPSTITIEAPFFGFPGIGHGGYTAGLISEHLPGPLEVRFANPPPLEVALSLVDRDGALALSDGEMLIADARRVDLDTSIPDPPSLREAELGMTANLNLQCHPSPTCMTCGPARAPGKGLRVLVGPVEGRDVVAGAWVPHGNFASEDGTVLTRFIWAALDCPTHWALRAAYGDQGRVVTARLAARLIAPIPADEPAIVMGWPVAKKGSRFLVGAAAIFSVTGEPLAFSEATWIRSGTSSDS